MSNYLFISVLFILGMWSCSCDCSTDADIVVIGGGLMGSSAAWHLSDQTDNLILLEQQDSIYKYGSSFGDARIARSNNRGDDMWSFLHNKSVKEIRSLIRFLNDNSSKLEHSMDEIYTTNPVTYVGRTSIHEKLLGSLKRQNVSFDMAVTPEEGMSMYDVILPDSVLLQREYNPYSGMINPRVLISKLHQGIRLKGQNVRYGYQVNGITHKGCCYEVEVINLKTGKAEMISTKKVVTAAGPYTGNLLKDIAPYFRQLINPQRVYLAFLTIKPEVYHGLSAIEKEKLKAFYPVINSSTGTREGSFFSMIEYYKDEIPIIKIGGHFQRSEIENLDEVWKLKLSDAEVEWSINSTKRYFDLLKLPIKKEDIHLVDQYSCVYSLTKSEVPLVTPIIDEDRNPDHNFIVMGGMSGVGAKGAMCYGKLASYAMNEKEEAIDSSYGLFKERMGFNRLLQEVEALSN